VNNRKVLGVTLVLAAVVVVGLALPGRSTPVGERGAAAHTSPAKAPIERATFVDPNVRPCQALGPAAPYCIEGVDCAGCGAGCGEASWDAMGPIPWQAFAQGEYVGHQRTAHVHTYRLRVDDEIDVVYRLTREETSGPYELEVGDQIQVESFTDEQLNRELIVQPDGTITLRLLGQVRAVRRTIQQLREDLDERYKKYYKVPAITVTPLQVNTRLEDLRASVDARAGRGGQGISVRVTPAGTIQLPALGSVPVQGLTLDELRSEIDARYAETIPGISVTPVLLQRAPRYVYVLGEVATPGRFTLEGPTTAMQAIALAGGWNVGANLRQIVVFRRGDDWRLMATQLDLRGALYGKSPCPSDEIWLNDSDIVLVPKGPVLVANEFIEQVFTRGLYGVVPLQGVNWEFTSLSTIARLNRF
jgi:polysaccharide export outer membrane protein